MSSRSTTFLPGQSVPHGRGTKEDGPRPRAAGSRGALLRGLVVTALVSYLVFFAGLGDASLWHSQEGRVVRIAQYMLQSGDWITPAPQEETLEAGKPVLYHWLVALLGWLRGFDEVTARAPSAGAALVVAIVLYLWVRRLTDDRSGLVAALAFATSLQVMSLARCAHVDMLLTLWVVLAYYFFFLGYQEERHRRRWFLLTYVAVALAVMTKGPVGLALVGVGVGTFLLVRGKLKLLGRVELLPGALIFLALTAPWYVAVAIKTHGDFLVQFFVQQNLARFFTTRTGTLHPSKADPWWFYGPQLLLATLPWTPLVLGSLLDRASTLWKRRGASARDEATALGTAWFAAGLLLLSLSKGKRSGYLLPLLPSLALLGGCFWHSAFSQEQTGRHRLARIATVGQAVILAVGASFLLSLTVLSPVSHWWKTNLMLPFFSGQPALFSSLVGALRDFVPLGLAVTLALALAAWLWLKPAFGCATLGGSRRRHLIRTTFAFTVGLVLACQWLYQQAALPVLDEWFGFRTVAAEIDRVVPAGHSVTVFGGCPQSLLFYLSRPTQLLRPSQVETLAQLTGEPTPFYCLLSLENYLLLTTELREQLRPLYQTSAEAREHLVLAANNPARAPIGPATGHGEVGTGDPKVEQ